MSERVNFLVPLPPVELRANTRAFWAKRKKAADEYSVAVWCAARHARRIFETEGLRSNAPAFSGFPATAQLRTGPWERAKVTYTWRYAGRAPDHGNLGGHTKYLQDILCCAPKLPFEQAEKYKRWHLGIVADDAGIEAEYRMEKVAHRADEAILVEIVRIE